MGIKRARTMRSEVVPTLLQEIETQSRYPERDAAVLLLGLTCGMRITEIASLRLSDVLTKKGELRSEVPLRASTTKGGRSRNVYLTNPQTRLALSRYLETLHRFSGQIGTSQYYRGFNPVAPLIVAKSGKGYRLIRKRRTLVSGEKVEYLASDGLQAYVSSLYRKLGMDGFTSHSGRRSFATQLVQSGEDIATVQTLLGHVDIDHVGVYVDVNEASLREAVRKVL
ncbi:tyrosine-type recombinase/integrase [Cupriavidus sp. TMH.W2]|uniref:tyrosine-type recombinase/integrase n=1 Tax=Cupriavidus sp. TMH.W2 TaxID=3434465 RepID=UPI003D77F8A1